MKNAKLIEKRLESSLLVMLAMALLLAGCTPTSQPATRDTRLETPTAYADSSSPTAPGAILTTPRPTSAPSQNPERGSSAPQRGGGLVIALDDAILTLDPADYRHRQTETVIRNIFDGLITRTREGQVVPEIAESCRWVDGRTLEFVIRPGITFHNGEDLTAEDVQFSFERLITESGIEFPEPHTSPRKALLGPLEKMESIDTYTVRFHFKAPWPIALQMLVHQHILPKSYFEQVGNEGFIQAPIGSGPFEFVEANLEPQAGDRQEIVLERFEDYYGGAPDLPPVGPAFLDRLTFVVIKDVTRRVGALQAGEVDIIQSLPSFLIPVLDADHKVEVKTAPGTRPYWMEMNVNRPPFDDVRVRQAMNYAVDAELIVGAFLGGLGVILPGPLSPYNNFTDPSLEPYGYNPTRAIEMLTEAGYPPQNISFTIDCREASQGYAEAIATQLRELGMDITVQVWDYSELRPLLLAGERMAYVDGWGDSAFDPVGHFEAKWHTWVEGSDYGRGNFSTYSNPRVDELIETGEVEAVTDKRHQIYNEAQQIIYKEAPAVFLFLPDTVEASSVRVQNWSPSPDGRLNMHDVWVGEDRD